MVMKDSNFKLIDYDTVLIKVGLFMCRRSSMLEISIMDPRNFGSTKERNAFNGPNVNIVINVSIRYVAINPCFISNSTHGSFSLTTSSVNESSISHEAPVSYVMSSKEVVSFEAYPRSGEGK